MDLTSQLTLRAKPCCWISPGPNWGQQWLRPPLMGLLPSTLASGLTAMYFDIQNDMNSTAEKML